MSVSQREEALRLIEILDKAESDMLDGLVLGMSIQQVAEALRLEIDEALALKQSLMRKLNAATIADLVRIGIYSQAG